MFRTARQLVLAVVCVVVLLQGTLLVRAAMRFLYRFFVMRELDLPARYGRGSWAVITGASSGQGRHLAHEIAARGFHLLLIGSVRSHACAAEIRRQHPTRQVEVMVVDFGRAFEPGFFDAIATRIAQRDVAMLINNVGHRTGWAPFHEQPEKVMRETIACGTLVQTRLTQLALQRFARRRRERAEAGVPPLRTALVFITAQCMHGNFGLASGTSNEITVPYLSVYEPSNAFGYYHACSIQQEYGCIGDSALGDTLDILNVTPGAVVTENTSFLQDTLFAVPAHTFAQNILRLLGNVQGTTCAHWGHALTTALLSLCPWAKDRVLQQVGSTIAHDYMRRHESHSLHERYATTTQNNATLEYRQGATTVPRADANAPSDVTCTPSSNASPSSPRGVAETVAWLREANTDAIFPVAPKITPTPTEEKKEAADITSSASTGAVGVGR